MAFFEPGTPADKRSPALPVWVLVPVARLLSESDENVETANADSAGNLVTGHTLDTASLPIGRYQVVLRADADGLAPAFTTLSLRVVPPEIPLAQWSAYGPFQPADDDLKRGLAAQALGRTEEARKWFTDVLDANGQNSKALSYLVALLSATGKIGDIAALHDRPAFRNAVDINTLILVSNAIAQNGNPRQAIDLITAQIALQPPSALLYDKLAVFYDETGRHAQGTRHEGGPRHWVRRSPSTSFYIMGIAVPHFWTSRSFGERFDVPALL